MSTRIGARPQLLNVAFWICIIEMTVSQAVWTGSCSWIAFGLYGGGVCCLAVLWAIVAWEASAKCGRKRLSLVVLALALLLSTFGVGAGRYELVFLSLANIALVYGAAFAFTYLGVSVLVAGMTALFAFAYEPRRALVFATNIAVFGILVVGLALGLNERNRRLRSANQLLLRMRDLATVAERKRMARVLHDAVGRDLTILRLNLENAERLRSIGDSEAWAEVGRAKSEATEAIADIRQCVQTLNAPAVSGDSVASRFEQICQRFAGAGLDVDLSIEGAENHLSHEIELVLLDVAQEALTNVLRHSTASRVLIRLTYTNGMICLYIEDNGERCPDSFKEGFGITLIRSRVSSVEGRTCVGALTAESQRSGFFVEVRIPGVGS